MGGSGRPACALGLRVRAVRSQVFGSLPAAYTHAQCRLRLDLGAGHALAFLVRDRGWRARLGGMGSVESLGCRFGAAAGVLAAVLVIGRNGNLRFASGPELRTAACTTTGGLLRRRGSRGIAL